MSGAGNEPVSRIRVVVYREVAGVHNMWVKDTERISEAPASRAEAELRAWRGVLTAGERAIRLDREAG